MTSALSVLRTRVRAMPPRQADGLLATLVVAVTALEVAFADATTAQRAEAALPAALAATALLVRRRDPLAALALALGSVVSTAVLSDAVWHALNAVYLVLLLVIYSMAARESGRRLVAGIALAVAGVAVMGVLLGDREDTGPLAATLATGLALFVVAPVVAGRLLHSRVSLDAALDEKARRVEVARDGLAREAAAAERARIAGELHDVVAHALGAMTIQAAAARRLATGSPERAVGAFEAIEAAGRDALGELRTLLDALRDDSAPDPLHAPKPTLAALGELAERARAAGLEVTLELDDHQAEALPATVDVTAYRVVQEALQAALHHGGAAAATVRLRHRGDRLEIEVCDDGVRIADRRLLGLRERVGLFGGEVRMAAEAGGHRVSASLPLAGVAA